MVQAGVLTEDDRVELIEGEILEVSPIGSRHAACVARLTALFSSLLRDAAIVWVQNPVQLNERSEPQPDLALLRTRQDYYATGHPSATDVYLLIEVAETSVEYDREVKVPLYARAGVAETWLVDLTSQQILVYTDPGQAGYSLMRALGRGEAARPTALPAEVALPVSDILG
jgi:Uma2 family endonuclease